SHLRDKYKISTNARKDLSRLLKTLPLSKPDDASPAEHGSPEHPKLQVYDGFACCKCKSRTIYFLAMRCYFLDPLAIDCPSNTAAVRYSNIDHLFGYSVYKREEVRHAAAGSEQQEVSALQIANLTYTEQSCWIKRTGWDKTYRDKSRQALIVITQMPYEYSSNSSGGLVVYGLKKDLVSPPEDEERIACIVSQVDALMDRCEETAEKMSCNLRSWLRSTRPRSAYIKPFELVQLPYRCYNLRTLLELCNSPVKIFSWQPLLVRC
ncbi:hypothetical protein EDB80DRAFT_594986, partial [Ilyonectria destructans]